MVFGWFRGQVDDTWDPEADDAIAQQLAERAALLTPDEKAAVCDYLEYLDATHGADFPVFGPKQALKYWSVAR